MTVAWNRRILLLRTLLQRGRIQTAQAATLLDTTRRTALRDLATLEAHGVPVYKEGEGQAEAWVLARSWRHSGLSVDLDDRLALLFGRELIGAFMRGTEVADSAERLTRALGALDPDAPASDAELRRRFFYVHEPEKDYSEHRGTVATLMHAILEQRRVRFTYKSGRSRRTRAYTLAIPLTLAAYKRSLYLFFRPRGEVRVLRYPIERMSEVELEALDFDYPPPAEYSPASELAGVFGIATGRAEAAPVRLRFAPEVAAIIKARRWMPDGSHRVIDRDDGGCTLEMTTTGLELVSWVLSFGDKVVVEEPSWLRDAVVAELEAALESYRA